MARSKSLLNLKTNLGRYAPEQSTDYERECLAWRTLAARLGWLTPPHYGHGDHGWFLSINGLGFTGEGTTLEEAVLDVDYKITLRAGSPHKL